MASQLMQSTTRRPSPFRFILENSDGGDFKDVAQRNPTSEEDAISKAQQLELIYTQLGYIYNILPNAPCLQSYLEFPGTSNSANELIRSMAQGYLGSSSQNPGYTHGSTQNMSQPGFQSRHMQQQNLTKTAPSYHQGEPYPKAEGTKYIGRKTNRISPPQQLGANIGQ